MSNPFASALGGPGCPQKGPMNMLQAFQQFASSFQGDPKAEVEKLLTSGRINQQQLNELQNTARQIQAMLGVK